MEGAVPLPRPGRRRGLRTALTLLVLVLALAAVGVAQTAVGRRVAASTGLRVDPERFTELFFAGAGNVGTRTSVVAPGIEAQNVAFVLHNQLGTAQTYDWSISANAIHTVVLDTGSVRVPRNRYATVAKRLRMDCASIVGSVVDDPSRQLTVTVSVLQSHESINFHTVCYASAPVASSATATGRGGY